MFLSRLVHTFCSAPILSILKPIKFGWNPNFNFILMYKCANTVQFHLSLWMKAVGKVFFCFVENYEAHSFLEQIKNIFFHLYIFDKAGWFRLFFEHTIC